VRYYPLFLDISGRRCVIVGGGTVAERKVRRLLECGARVEVVSVTLTAVLDVLKQEGRIVHHEADYDGTQLHGAFLVIGATDNSTVNERVYRDARAGRILANIVDQPRLCDFILPSLVERGDLAIAVSTSGRSPALAKQIRTELEDRYGPEYGILAGLLGELRDRVLAGGRPADENREKFEALLASDILEKIRARRWDEVKALILERTGVEMEVWPG